MRALFLTACIVGAVACGRPAEAPAPEAKAEAPKPKPPDESRRFPKEGQTSMELVDDRLLGKDYLPGGNLATYEKDGKTYQLFLVMFPDAEKSSFALLDAQESLTDPKFVASFGGYYGLDGETPWFVFGKGKCFAGVVGLPQDEADLAARDFAARIPAQ